MMTRTALATTLLVLMPHAADAALHDRGGGLIYDDVLNVTWLQDANYAGTLGLGNNGNGRMNHADALSWVASLSFYDSVRDVTYNDWRLPTVAPVNGIAFNTAFSNNGTTDEGYTDANGWRDPSGNPASELGHLFYVSLGNLGLCTPNGGGSSTGCVQQDGWLDRTTNPFINYQTSFYWTGTTFIDALTIEQVFQLSMGSGEQHTNSTGGLWYVWAVRDGDVAAVVPVPATAWLFTGALASMVGLRRRRSLPAS